MSDPRFTDRYPLATPAKHASWIVLTKSISMIHTPCGVGAITDKRCMDGCFRVGEPGTFVTRVSCLPVAAAPSASAWEGPVIANTARDIMTPGAECVGEAQSLVDVARKMRDLEVECVVDVRGRRPAQGHCHDRDNVMKCVAEGGDPGGCHGWVSGRRQTADHWGRRPCRGGVVDDVPASGSAARGHRRSPAGRIISGPDIAQRTPDSECRGHRSSGHQVALPDSTSRVSSGTGVLISADALRCDLAAGPRRPSSAMRESAALPPPRLSEHNRIAACERADHRTHHRLRAA